MAERVPKDGSDYAPFLTLCFEEEIMGEAYFIGLTRYFPEPHQREKLSLLSRIERCVADSARPLLERHGLSPRSDDELHAIGAEGVIRHSGSTWRKFMEDITVTFPQYMDEFAALVRVAPSDDHVLLKPFTTHEIAGIEFAKRELNGDPDSAEILNNYIRNFQS